MVYCCSLLTLNVVGQILSMTLNVVGQIVLSPCRYRTVLTRIEIIPLNHLTTPVCHDHPTFLLRNAQVLMKETRNT